MNNTPQLIADALRQPKDAITYAAGQALQSLFPDRAILHGSQGSFDVEEYAKAGYCDLRLSENAYSQVVADWHGPEYGLQEDVQSGWHSVEWNGRSLEVVWITVAENYSKPRYYWIIADAKETAETFLAAVCDWNRELREEVYLFEGGCWHKSKELYRSIQDATFERLILPAALKSELQSDFEQFFACREVYERYRLPWKRGVLLIGPPGNGKTHTVKALINWLGVSCLYVKSFKAQYATDHACIQQVFQRARRTTPCVLVLEDLDSLITDKNRSYFLNEMDGFMSNHGILVLATTNHPERLDPAILERPSRFDRKYYFELPATAEREAYMRWWNNSIEPELRLTSDGLIDIVSQTDDFSYAYLKELWLASMMRWINSGESGPGIGSPAGAMDRIMASQVDFLREQMTAAKDAQPSVTEIGFDMSMVPAHLRRYVSRYMNTSDGSDYDSDEDDSDDGDE